MQLLPYQKEDVTTILTRFKDKPTVLGHEMGLGKTIIAIECINRIAPETVLILCPASVKGVWEAELETWLSIEKRVDVLHTTKDAPYLMGDIIICSYDLAIHPRVLPYIVRRWDMAIYDEAHCLGNLKSKRVKLILGNLWPLVEKPLFLTGSIYRDKIIQLYPIFGRIAPKVFGGYWRFARRYCYLEKTKWGVKAYGGQNLEELNRLAEKHFLIRRRKADVLKDLPDKIEQKVYVYIPESEQAAQKQAMADFEADFEQWIEKEKKPPPAIATIRRELGESKVFEAREYIEEFRQDNPEEPLVVFCYHRSVHKRLLQSLSNNFKVSCITGETPEDARDKAVKDFQTGEVDIFLATFAAAEGITLARASTAIFVEQSWSLMQNEQAIDRLHRIGQKNQVQIKFLVAKNTLDETVYKVYKQKADIKKRAFG